ncbi:zf-CCHC domain-containing protein [Tanacetum coccineum]
MVWVEEDAGLRCYSSSPFTTRIKKRGGNTSRKGKEIRYELPECTPTKDDTLRCSSSTPISSKLKRNSSKKIKEGLRKKGKAVGRTLIDSCDKGKEKVDEFPAATPTKEHQNVDVGIKQEDRRRKNVLGSMAPANFVKNHVVSASMGQGSSVKVRIYQKSHENHQNQASTDTGIRRVQKEAKDSKPKPGKSSLSQNQLRKVKVRFPLGNLHLCVALVQSAPVLTKRLVLLSPVLTKSQVKDNKIDLWVQQYEQFVISEDESIDSAFARFNTIITSLKALDEGYSSKNYVRKFLRALHPKWRAKVTTIEESKDLTSLSLDELIGNLKVHEMIIKKDSEIVKAKEERRSLALKAKKEFRDEEYSTSGSKDEKYAMAVRDFKKCGDPNHLIGECPKPPKEKNQRAFIGGSWSDSGEEDDEKDKDETCLMAKASSEGLKESRMLKHGELNLVMGNRKITLVTRIGKYELMLKSGGYALEITAYILNLVPTKKVSKTPFETWKGKCPSLWHIKIWGYEVFVRREAHDKLEARFEKCLFVSYLEELFGYLFYKPKDNVSVDEEPIVNTDTQQVVVTPVKPDDISLPIRRTSGRVSKPSHFYYGFHIEEDNICDSTLSELDEPTNYKEAMASPKAAKWKEAMKSEIQSMYDNQVDDKTAFLNGKLTADVFMAQPKDDIILIGNDIPTLQSVKDWLGKYYAMKDLGDASYILGIKIYRDRLKPLIRLSQDTYLHKILKRFKMKNSKKGNLPLHHGIKISKDLCSKTDEELDRISRVPYALAVRSIMYVMTCTSPDVSHPQTGPGRNTCPRARRHNNPNTK